MSIITGDGSGNLLISYIVDDLYCGTCGQKIDWHNDNLRKGKI